MKLLWLILFLKLKLNTFTASAKYHKQLPSKLIVVGVFESTFNTNLVHSMPIEYHNHEPLEKYTTPGILGLFLPWNKKLNVYASYVLENDFYVPGFNSGMNFHTIHIFNFIYKHN